MSLKLLAFETATEACSVALYIDGQISQRVEVAPRRHAELCLPWADQLLAEAEVARSQLDAVAVGCGPGAFTGVRLGMAVAQGIALGLDRPLLPVSTLHTLALRAPNSAQCVLACIDARMGQVYAACYRSIDNGLLQLWGEEQLLTPDALLLPDNQGVWSGVGSGFTAAGGVLSKRLQSHLLHVDASALPQAADLLKLAVPAFLRGQAQAPEHALPRYLRNHVALTLQQQRAQRRAS